MKTLYLYRFKAGLNQQWHYAAIDCEIALPGAIKEIISLITVKYGVSASTYFVAVELLGDVLIRDPKVTSDSQSEDSNPMEG